MRTQRVMMHVVLCFVVCGFSSIGVTYAESGARATQNTEVTTAETKAAAAHEKAEAARKAAEQADKEAVAAQEHAASAKQKFTADRVAALERELAAFKAQDTKRGLVLRLADVQFAPQQENLTPETMQHLYPFVMMLKEQPTRTIHIKGYTDNSGEKSYNLDLSQRRADAVRDFLIAKGIRAERITARGYGEEKTVASNDTAEGRRENRRVEILVPRAGKRAATR